MRLPASIFFFTGLIVFAPAQTVDLRKQATEALGDKVQGTFQLTGITEHNGLWEKIDLYTDLESKFKAITSGPLPLQEGFDGKGSWSLNQSGVPHKDELSEAELTRLMYSVVTGTWATSLDVLATTLPPAEDFPRLEVAIKGSVAKAILYLDPKTFRPAKLSHWGPDGDTVWTFSDYRAHRGRFFPMRADHNSGGKIDRTSFQLIRSDSLKISFGMPEVDESIASFDNSMPSTIEVKRYGPYVFVKPKLDGVEEGWFFFDTGAEVMVLDPKVAEKHKAIQIGHEQTTGVVANTDLGIVQGIPFQLGPISLKNPTYFSLDLSGISKALGFDVVGIVGYDYISRGSFVIEPTGTSMQILAPGKVSLPKGADWHAFTFNGNVPALRAKFEGDHEGWFNMDTGSGSIVDFMSPTVEKLDLLKNREVVTTQTGGAGGSAESKLGTIEYFEVGGQRFEKVKAGFQLTKKGVFGTPFFEGNIGMGLMAKSRLFLDYRNSRMALVKP